MTSYVIALWIFISFSIAIILAKSDIDEGRSWGSIIGGFIVAMIGCVVVLPMVLAVVGAFLYLVGLMLYKIVMNYPVPVGLFIGLSSVVAGYIFRSEWLPLTGRAKDFFLKGKISLKTSLSNGVKSVTRKLKEKSQRPQLVSSVSKPARENFENYAPEKYGWMKELAEGITPRQAYTWKS